MDKIQNLLKDRILPKEYDIKNICNKAKEILINEDNVVRLYPPISVCGDIHGQFFDLLELFLVGDKCPRTKYCFLGDYVDRGYYSLETFLYLLILKVRFPNHITLLRGNHETNLNKSYGFYFECMRKFNDEPNVYRYCSEIFNLLPIAATINDRFFLVHGGLSPNIPKIDDINIYNRNKEPDDPILDLLWSDPSEDIDKWVISERGCGYLFGKDVVDEFNEINGLDCIYRAHQLVDEGYRYYFDKKLCIVWSCPNYIYRCGNKASILEIDENMNTYFNMFEEAPDYLQHEPDDRDDLYLTSYFL